MFFKYPLNGVFGLLKIQNIKAKQREKETKVKGNQIKRVERNKKRKERKMKEKKKKENLAAWSCFKVEEG